jgi:hypothetical protein
MKRIVTFLIAMSIFATALNLFATDTQTKKTNTSESQKIIDVGNKTCPFLGDRVSGKDFVVYKGKRYGLCGSHCKDKFLQDPERYIKVLKRREGIE